MTKELPTEVILCIASLLTSELDKFSFAFANKRHWSICCSATTKILDLENTITALQLRKHCVFAVQNSYYDKVYMEHFSNAAHLHTVVINKRKLYSFSFALLLLQSVPSNKMDGVMVDTTKIVTLEHVRVQIDETRQALKRQHYLNHPEAAIFKNELCHLIAASINRFFNAKSYLLYDDDFSNDVIMKKTDMNTKEARQLIDTHCPKFVESVVILAGYCFIHNNISIDDSSKPLRRKTRLGKDYFELTLRFGFVELLATGGSIDDSSFSPFLGSSIQELPTQITAAIETISVFILKEPVAHVCNNRSL
ncbi:hypothetical protein EDC96DRAFT_558021 [Choanephora cucurbitarum]|nr:hypothetical protein EDC96DRAFT_558021 [Choanephora cucurbitarum]